MNFLKFTPSTRELLICLKVDDTEEKKVPITRTRISALSLPTQPRASGPLTGSLSSPSGSPSSQWPRWVPRRLPSIREILLILWFYLKIVIVCIYVTLQFPHLFCTHASHYSHPVCSWKSAREQIWDCRTLCSIILNGKNNNMSQLIQERQPITQMSENPFDIYRGCLYHRRHLKHQSPNYVILHELIGEHVCVQYTYGIRFF